MNLRKWILAAMILVWAVRLGAYLLYRIHLTGKDNRFDALRDTLAKIFTFWFL